MVEVLRLFLHTNQKFEWRATKLSAAQKHFKRDIQYKRGKYGG